MKRLLDIPYTVSLVYSGGRVIGRLSVRKGFVAAYAANGTFVGNFGTPAAAKRALGDENAYEHTAERAI